MRVLQCCLRAIYGGGGDEVAYAIMRIEKRRDLASVRRCADHHLRAVDTPNADPMRGIRVLAGSADARDVTALIRDTTGPLMKRKDGIRAMDVFCGASPEFFEAGGSVQQFEAIALSWASSTFGADNIQLAVTHEDELTPHVQMLVTPITPQGKLAASYWLDGPKKLEALQDTFAAAMAPLGLERGVKGSKARHEDVRRWYAELLPQMRTAEARIEEAQKTIENAKLADADLVAARSAIAADQAEVKKLKAQIDRVELYQQNQAKKNSEKAAKVAAAEAAMREEIQKLGQRDIALKAAEKSTEGERQARIDAERKNAVLAREKVILEGDKNVLHNEVISLRKQLRKHIGD